MDTHILSFFCTQHEYTADMNKQEITLGKIVGGFLLFEVPFYLCGDGTVRPVEDIVGYIQDRSTKTILSVTLSGRNGNLSTEPEYFFVEPHTTKVCAGHDNFVMPLPLHMR